MLKSKKKTSFPEYSVKESKKTVVYIRFQESDIKKIDQIKKKLNIDTRSETVRYLSASAAEMILRA